MSKTKLLHGMIDLMEAGSKKTTSMLHAQVAKLEPRSTVPEPEPSPPGPDPIPPAPGPDPGPTYPEPDPAPRPPLDPGEAPLAI